MVCVVELVDHFGRQLQAESAQAPHLTLLGEALVDGEDVLDHSFFA